MLAATRCRFGRWSARARTFGLAVLAALSFGAAASAATPPTFTALGVLPGGSSSSALAVTPGGSFVVGYSTTPFGDRAFRWSRVLGLQSLGTLPGDTDSRAVAVSADGKVVVGFSKFEGGYHAFRWTGAAGMTDLGVLPGGASAVVTGISADGAVVVGYCDVPASSGGVAFHAFRWTAPGGMEDLGTLPDGLNSYVTAISGDGTVMVGSADGGASFGLRAMRRTDQSGMVNLGAFPDEQFTFANAVSVDGSTVAGAGFVPPGYRAFRWTDATGMEDLGSLPGATVTIADSISGDGRIIVGRSDSPSGEAAFLWTADLGPTNLNTHLQARGIDLTGWTLIAANAVSADGLTIVGLGDHDGHEEAWVAFLGTGQDLSAIEQLGKSLMSDSNLSSPGGQACFSCHSAAAGFTNPRSIDNAHGSVHPGAVASLFGNRKPPTAAYAGPSPPLHLEDGTWVGGLFFDGRATGWTLGDPLAEQAMQPFLNPVEQNNPDSASVVAKVASSNYAALFRDVWGEDSLPPDGGGDVALAYERIARSIAAYGRSRAASPFNSKYDEYLAGRATLSPQEALGLKLFNGNAGCAACHPSAPGPNGEPPLFTDFTYDNVGIPRNPENPFYSMPPEINADGDEYIDPGLGGFLQQAGFPQSVYGPAMGKHKVATLRNVDRRPDGAFVRSYGHNGFFKSLEDIVHFYNTRDVEAWPPPEVPQNMNIAEMGNLHLTPDEEAAIVAFLKTLTDRDVSPVHCPSDFDSNGFVNGVDFDRFVSAFEAGSAGADIDRDGFVTGLDFDLFVLAFEAGC